MIITWLGQAGFLLKTEQATVMIDPYLSDSVARVQPQNARRVPVDDRFFQENPDLLLFTHNHLDHYDPETAEVFLRKDYPKTVLCPKSVWETARANAGKNNYIRFNRGTVYTEKGLRFTAVKAEHSDDDAIGFLIEDQAEGKTYYITGDTLYSKAIFADLPEHIFAVFLPINGVGNNMNPTDALAFARRCGARYIVPCYTGMFDDISPGALKAENAVYPEIYQTIRLS